MDQYCSTYSIAGDMREDFEYHIRMMDAEYLKFRAKQAEARSKK